MRANYGFMRANYGFLLLLSCSPYASAAKLLSYAPALSGHPLYLRGGACKQTIKKFEPNAFIVITDAYSIYGEGFRPLPNPSEIVPE